MAFVKKPEDGLRVLLELKKASDFLHYEDGFKERKLDPCFYLDTAGMWLAEPRSERPVPDRRLPWARPRRESWFSPALTMEPYTQTRRNIPQELLDAGCTGRLHSLGSPERSFLAEVAVLVRAGYDRTKAIQGMTLAPGRAARPGLGDRRPQEGLPRGPDLPQR